MKSINKSRNYSIKKSIYYSYYAQVVSLFTNFFLSIILINNLDLKVFGEYSFFISAIIFLGVVVNFGLENSFLRFGSEFLEKKNNGKVNNLLLKILLIRLILLFIISCLLILFFTEIKNIFKITIDLKLFFIFLSIFIVIKVKSIIGRSFLTIYLQVYNERLNEIVYQISKLILFFLILIAGKGFKEILISWLCLEIFSIGHYIYLLLKKTLSQKKNLISNFSKKETNRIIKFSNTQAIIAIIFLLSDVTLDNIMIGYFLDQESVAIYSFTFALLFLTIKFNPPSILKGTFISLITKDFVLKKSISMIRDYHRLLLKLGLIISAPLLTILSMNLEKIITLIYSPNYLPAIPLINIGIIFMFFFSCLTSFSIITQVLEKNKFYFFVGFFSILNVIGNILLIPMYGELGALISSGVSLILIFFYYMVKYTKIYKMFFFPYIEFFKIILSCLPLMFLHIIFNDYINSLIGLIFIVISQIITYILVIKKFSIFLLNEKILLNNIFKKKIFITR